VIVAIKKTGSGNIPGDYVCCGGVILHAAGNGENSFGVLALSVAC
jgi:hypothetical protein